MLVVILLIKSQTHLVPDRTPVYRLRNAFVHKAEFLVKMDFFFFTGKYDPLSAKGFVFPDHALHDDRGISLALLIRSRADRKNHLPVALGVMIRGISVHIIRQISFLCDRPADKTDQSHIIIKSHPKALRKIFHTAFEPFPVSSLRRQKAYCLQSCDLIQILYFCFSDKHVL